MKKTISGLIGCMLAVLILGCMTACSSKVPSAEEVATKINEGGNLSQSDYTVMLDYCGDYAKEAQKYYDIINAQPNDSTAESVKAADSLASLYAKYKYLDSFRQNLASVDVSALGTENEKKVSEFAKYQGFPLPEGEGADLQNPEVVGEIEQIPEDSSAVIATGVGEAVDEKVK